MGVVGFLLFSLTSIIINQNHLAVLSTIFFMNSYSYTRFRVSCLRFIMVASKWGLLSTHFFFILVTNTLLLASSPFFPYFKDLLSIFLREDWSIVWWLLFFRGFGGLGSIDLQRKELRIFSLSSLLLLNFSRELMSRFFFSCLLSLGIFFLEAFVGSGCSSKDSFEWWRFDLVYLWVGLCVNLPVTAT